MAGSHKSAPIAPSQCLPRGWRNPRICALRNVFMWIVLRGLRRRHSTKRERERERETERDCVYYTWIALLRGLRSAVVFILRRRCKAPFPSLLWRNQSSFMRPPKWQHFRMQFTILDLQEMGKNKFYVQTHLWKNYKSKKDWIIQKEKAKSFN